MRRRFAIALAVWSLVVWTGRLRNIAGDTGLSAANVLLPLTFVLGGAVVATAAVMRARWLSPAVRVLAMWTIGVWAVRGTAILLADHDSGFKVVHTTLAVVSIALAVLALRSAYAAPASGRRRVPASSSGSRPRP